MQVHELQRKVDYLFCERCGTHVPCIRLRPGVWEVQCPRCVGDCGLCRCSQLGQCVGSNGVPVPTHTFVADPRTPE